MAVIITPRTTTAANLKIMTFILISHKVVTVMKNACFETNAPPFNKKLIREFFDSTEMIKSISVFNARSRIVAFYGIAFFNDGVQAW